MIFWEEYKKYKKEAEHILKLGFSHIPAIEMEIVDYTSDPSKKDKIIENIINILSGGQHYAPLHDFNKIGKQQDLF